MKADGIRIGVADTDVDGNGDLAGRAGDADPHLVGVSGEVQLRHCKIRLAEADIGQQGNRVAADVEQSGGRDLRLGPEGPGRHIGDQKRDIDSPHPLAGRRPDRQQFRI